MAQKTTFKPVDPKQDFVKMEKDILKFWYEQGIVKKYLKRNRKSKKQFSFLDGPITANNPMGIHHAWGRTYKDLWQRFYNMKGFSGRFQNGFDEQGLWVEVEVEKELGFKNKKDIEKYGIDKFVNKCKERVKKYSQIQTEQSKRLGYFMDWGSSYHTSSDENNYAIWNFLKVCYQKGYLYKGRDSVPWCPRCGTAISQHEILTEEYKKIIHKSVFVKYRLLNSDESLLVWTTTPWTLPSNIAIAVNPDFYYRKFTNTDTNEKVIIIEQAHVPDKTYSELIRRAGLLSPQWEIKRGANERIKGEKLIGKKYKGIFDELPALKGIEHKVVAAKDLVTADEGTGLVHIAPGAGEEDFKLAKEKNLPVIESIDESATYIEGFGDLFGKNAKDNPDLIIEKLKKKGVLFKVEGYKHRYPTCWRCKTELVWRVVDEWYIAMDHPSQDASNGKSKKTLREQMIDVAKEINWIPKFGLDRELDWLKNMHDWLISKKRYWGLALPIWECAKCGNFEVIGSKEELKEKAVEGWRKFEGNSPHRPWIDNVKIKCPKCQSVISRVNDVGNPWLDAGIVPFSTMPQSWFPADFITESFPGQFKNWFYSLIAMSTVLKNTNPFKTVLGFATLLDEKGEEMHKSKGNAVEFNEAADKIGVDVMRWLYVTQNPTNNLLFGYHRADDARRRFYLILWNSYKFFIDYANLASWKHSKTPGGINKKLNVLDRWILASLAETAIVVNKSLDKYDAATAAKSIKYFVVNDLSTWYIRRCRNRVGPTVDKNDENVFLSTLYGILVTLSKILAPFTPLVAEEIYRNLTGEESVHIATYPTGDKNLLDKNLTSQIKISRKLAEEIHSLRKKAEIKVRQPLASATYGSSKLRPDIENILASEVNVKKIIFKKNAKTSLNTQITQVLKTEGETRDIIRQIQQARKIANCNLFEKVTVKLPKWPKEFEDEIKRETLAKSLVKSEKLEIIRN